MFENYLETEGVHRFNLLTDIDQPKKEKALPEYKPT